MANEPIKPPIAVSAIEWEQVCAILHACLPMAKVWAFGSRATGLRLKRFSDLDLIVDGEGVNAAALARLEGAFEQSPLPFKVDVAELGLIAPEFQTRIAAEMVVLQAPNASPQKAA